MKTLEEQARDYCREKFTGPEVRHGKPIPVMLEDFAREQVHQALEEAAESAKTKPALCENFMKCGCDKCDKPRFIVDKDSILSLKEKY